MSRTTADETVEAVESVPSLETLGTANGGSSSAETRQKMIARAKGIIAGKRHEQPMVSSKSVLEFLERKEKVLPGPNPTPQAQQEILDWLNLQDQYGGHPVACFRAPDGHKVVLTWSDEEIDALFAELSPQEKRKVVIEYPEEPLPAISAQQSS